MKVHHVWEGQIPWRGEPRLVGCSLRLPAHQTVYSIEPAVVAVDAFESKLSGMTYSEAVDEVQIGLSEYSQRFERDLTVSYIKALKRNDGSDQRCRFLAAHPVRHGRPEYVEDLSEYASDVVS